MLQKPGKDRPCFGPLRLKLRHYLFTRLSHFVLLYELVLTFLFVYVLSVTLQMKVINSVHIWVLLLEQFLLSGQPIPGQVLYFLQKQVQYRIRTGSKTVPVQFERLARFNSRFLVQLHKLWMHLCPRSQNKTVTEPRYLLDWRNVFPCRLWNGVTWWLKGI